MLLKGLAFFAVSGAQLHVATAFKKVTAEEVWSAMDPGWNLGNTLDASPTEGSWNNKPVQESTFDGIHSAGFKSVRIPVTWEDHFDSQAPDYIVNEKWMTRVETVVDWALKRDFWVVLNVHHDSKTWADFSNNSTTLGERKLKFEKLWAQIAERFKLKSEKLILEPLNEPAGTSSKENADQYNDANQRFINVVRRSGGHNGDRLLSLPGLNTNVQSTVDWFKAPANASNYIVQFHDYDPWDFISTARGRTFWGSDADKQEIEKAFITFRSRFKEPAHIGEWGLSGATVENGAAWHYFDFFIRTAKKYRFATQLWDNGGDHYDRVNGVWRDPVKLAILQNAIKGIPNTLLAYGQPSTIWVKTDIASDVNHEIKLELNGNTVEGISSSRNVSLAKGTDFTISSAGINITSTYLKQILGDTTSGLKDTIKIKSNRGAEIPIEIRVYDTPTVTQKTITTPVKDLAIPVDFKGTRLATVQAISANGTYPLYDWTKYLGDLQKGRINWGGYRANSSDWSDFDVYENNIMLSATLLETIRIAGQPVKFTFEFWPRVPGNNQTVTITIK